MILERLKEYIDYRGISVAAFERSIGMANASFGKSLKNKGAIGTDKLEKILSIYPEISPVWLMTGEGDMLKTKRTPENLQAQESTNSDYKDSKNQTLGQDIPPLILDRLLNTIAEKDAIIREQAEELGRLREQIEQFKKGRGHNASNVNTSEIANVG